MFRETLDGKSWRCGACSKPNAAGIFMCNNCSTTMPHEFFGKYMVFKQYKHVALATNVKLFEFAL